MDAWGVWGLGEGSHREKTSAIVSLVQHAALAY